MAKKTVALSIAIRNAERAPAALRGLGEAGQKAFQQIAAAKPEVGKA